MRAKAKVFALCIFFFIIGFCVAITIVHYKNSDKRKSLKRMEGLCLSNGGELKTSGKADLHEFKNRYNKVKNNKFKITIICEEQK